MKFSFIFIIFQKLYIQYIKVNKNNLKLDLVNINSLYNKLNLNLFLGVNSSNELSLKLKSTLEFNIKDNYLYIPKNLINCRLNINCIELDNEFIVINNRQVKRIQIFITFDKYTKINKKMPLFNIYIENIEESYGTVSLGFLNYIAKELFILDDNYLWGIDQKVNNLSYNADFNIEYKSLIFNYSNYNSIKFININKYYKFNWMPVVKNQNTWINFTNNISSTIFSIEGDEEKIKFIKSKFYDEKNNFIKIFNNYLQILVDNNNDTIEFYDKNLVDRSNNNFRFEFISSDITDFKINFNEGFYNKKMKILKISKKNELIWGYDNKKYSFKKNFNFLIFYSFFIFLGIVITFVLIILKNKRNILIRNSEYEIVQKS